MGSGLLEQIVLLDVTPWLLQRVLHIKAVTNVNPSNNSEHFIPCSSTNLAQLEVFRTRAKSEPHFYLMLCVGKFFAIIYTKNTFDMLVGKADGR